MIEALQRFFEVLHDGGVRSSPAERLDALRALECVGVADRARVKQALRATLVKHAAQRGLFDTTFDRFFAAPGRARRGRRRRAGAKGGEVKRTADASAAAAGAPRGREPRHPERDRRSPEALRRALAELRDGRRERWGRLRQVAVRAPREREPDASRPRGRTALVSLRARPEANRRNEIERELRRLIERIRMGAARRLERASRGRPFPRRLFRDSLASDGVPFRIPRRRRRTRTPRVWLLIDVSWSTAHAAGLFLEMASEFVRLGRQCRVIFFVDRPVDATEHVEDWIARGDLAAFVDRLRTVPGVNPDAPSDYGRTFHRLLVSPRRPRGRRSLLVVLGDGRNNEFDPQAWAFAELADGCGATLWLVPEPIEAWGGGDSALAEYLSSVDTVVEADDLDGLARGVARLVRRL
ncbi:MAG TPA: VWA domain-containing protein [Candidatus Polarisedimenticolaceae bacterium]|nr:VWA domain-containing protein [Candidatus Polarisedimenticolaceae bacterium]